MHSTKRPPLQAELPTFYVFAACSDCLLGSNTERSGAAVAKKAGRWNVKDGKVCYSSTANGSSSSFAIPSAS
jgi:hypothetical protein